MDSDHLERPLKITVILNLEIEALISKEADKRPTLQIGHDQFEMLDKDRGLHFRQLLNKLKDQGIVESAHLDGYEEYTFLNCNDAVALAFELAKHGIGTKVVATQV